MKGRIKHQLHKALLSESLGSKKSYIGQCDRLRRNCETNEGYWQEMMTNKKVIPFETFIQSVDMTPMLDEDETPEGFIQDSLAQDPETASYVSNWGDKQAMFLQVAGFEFIFV